MLNPLKPNTILFLILMLVACAPAPSTLPTAAAAVTNAAPPANQPAMPTTPASNFFLRSSEVSEGGALPREYTCDGVSSTLPLEWSGAPGGTKNFAVIMHHIPPAPEAAHWYWVVYNIPPSVTSLAKNVKGVGVLGNNSVNRKTEYTPPCSKGPGAKIYAYTVYALSAEPQITVPPSQVNRDALLAAIKNITLASAQLSVTYSR